MRGFNREHNFNFAKADNINRFVDFGMLDAWRVVLDLVEVNNAAKAFTTSVERKGDHYEIKMIGLNSRCEMIASEGKSVLGRKIDAFNLCDDFVAYLNGKKSVTFEVSYLQEPVKNLGE